MLLFILYSDLVVEVYYREFGKHTKSVNEFSFTCLQIPCFCICVYLYILYIHIIINLTYKLFTYKTIYVTYNTCDICLFVCVMLGVRHGLVCARRALHHGFHPNPVTLEN